MSKPVALSNIIFSNRDGDMVVREEYGLTFDSHETTEVFIQERFKYWKELLKVDLFMSPRSNETLGDIEIIKVFKLTAKHSGLNPKYVFKRNNSPNVVEVRRIASAICYDLSLSAATIGHASGFDRTNIIYHLKKFDNFYENEVGYKEKYEEIKKSVLNELNQET